MREQHDACQTKTDCRPVFYSAHRHGASLRTSRCRQDPHRTTLCSEEAVVHHS